MRLEEEEAAIILALAVSAADAKRIRDEEEKVIQAEAREAALRIALAAIEATALRVRLEEEEVQRHEKEVAAAAALALELEALQAERILHQEMLLAASEVSMPVCCLRLCVVDVRKYLASSFTVRITTMVVCRYISLLLYY